MDLVSMFIVIEFQNKSKRSSQHTLYHHDPGNRPPCVVSPWARCSGNLGGTFFKIGKKNDEKTKLLENLSHRNENHLTFQNQHQKDLATK